MLGIVNILDSSSPKEALAMKETPGNNILGHNGANARTWKLKANIIVDCDNVCAWKYLLTLQ